MRRQRWGLRADDGVRKPTQDDIAERQYNVLLACNHTLILPISAPEHGDVLWCRMCVSESKVARVEVRPQ